MDPRVKKMDEMADDDAPVDLHLDLLSNALADWRMVDPSLLPHRELLLKMLNIKKICYKIFDAKDVTNTQKDATLATLNQVMDEWFHLSPLLRNRSVPKDLAKEDNIKHLPTEEDIPKPEAKKDNIIEHLPTEEDSMTQLLPQEMEDVPELILPQEVATQVMPETVTMFLPQEVATDMSQSKMMDVSNLFLPQMEEPINMILPSVEDPNATLDHDEEGHDLLLSVEDGATKENNEFFGLPQTEVIDPVLPQNEPTMFGLPQTEVIMSKVSLAILDVVAKTEKDDANLPQQTVQRLLNTLAISAWCPSVSSYTAVQTTSSSSAAGKLFPVPLTGSSNVRDPCQDKPQSHRR